MKAEMQDQTDDTQAYTIATLALIPLAYLEYRLLHPLFVIPAAILTFGTLQRFSKWLLRWRTIR